MDAYYWETEYEHANNETTMAEFLDFYLSNEFDVIFEDGTYAEIENIITHEKWECHASGNGDFRHHKIEFKPIKL